MGILVTNIQRFCVHDGPGIRTTVFFKGCPLSCDWCHNPETKQKRNQILYNEKFCIGCGLCSEVCSQKAHIMDNTGHKFISSHCKQCLACAAVCPAKAIEAAATEYSLEQIFEQVQKDKSFYDVEGGMTLSGGEPLLHIDECLWLLRRAKSEGIGTAVETCGLFDSTNAAELVELTDLFLWDYKDTNFARHIMHTGVGNEKILSNLFLIDSLKGKILLRCIIVNDVNTDNVHIDGIADLYHKLTSCVGVELLPYHTYGGAKNKSLGYDDNGNTKWIPPKTVIESIKKKLAVKGVKVV